jgi:hypothetical protein
MRFRLLVVIAVTLGTVGSGIAATASAGLASSVGRSAAPHSLPAGAAVVRGTMTGIKLTRAQVRVLKRAYASHRWLSAAAARRLLHLASYRRSAHRGARAAASGYDSSDGDCSYMELWGDSSGNYHWFQEDKIAGASFGDASISTDGYFASVSDNWFWSGSIQDVQGQLSSVGFYASATTMSGWMVLTDDTYCSGSLFAVWQ